MTFTLCGRPIEYGELPPSPFAASVWACAATRDAGSRLYRGEHARGVSWLGVAEGEAWLCGTAPREAVLREFCRVCGVPRLWYCPDGARALLSGVRFGGDAPRPRRLRGRCRITRGAGRYVVMRRDAAAAPAAPPPALGADAAWEILAAAVPGYAVPADRYYWYTSLLRRRGLAEVYGADGVTATLLQSPDSLLLTDVATLPKLQRQGLASALVASLCAAADRPISLVCDPANVPFYGRSGFRRAGEARLLVV